MNDGRKRKAPKHQNKTVFKIQFDPLSLEIHKKVSFRGYLRIYLVFARDVPIRSPGNSNITNTKKWPKLPSAPTAIKKMYREHTWEHASPAQNKEMYAPNVYKPKPKNKLKSNLTNSNRKNRINKQREKWMSFWKLWRKDPEGLSKDFLRKKP